MENYRSVAKAVTTDRGCLAQVGVYTPLPHVDVLSTVVFNHAIPCHLFLQTLLVHHHGISETEPLAHRPLLYLNSRCL